MKDCTDPYQTILQKAFDRNIPFKVLWELTHHCNLNCIHCYRVEEPRPELSTAQATDLIDCLAKGFGLFRCQPINVQDAAHMKGPVGDGMQ